jgi:hypothetical protein
MRYYNDCLAFAIKLVKQFEDALACFAVEITRRLVSQKDAGIANKAPGDGYALFLTP